MPDRLQITRVACYGVILDSAGRILLCRMGPNEAAAGQWTLPGGGLDFGENLLDGLRREIEEETGLHVTDAEHLDTHDELIVRDEAEYHAVRVVYRVTVGPGEPRHETDGSTDRCAYVSLDELADLPRVPLVNVAVSLISAGPPRPTSGA